MLTAFKILLSRHSGQKDIVIGTPIANRNREEFEQLIGCFLGTLPLRSNLEHDPTFIELLKGIRSTVLEAIDNQGLPFEKLVEILNPDRSLTHTPLFQVLFNYFNPEEVPLSLSGLEVESQLVPCVEAKYDLTLYVSKSSGRIRLQAVFDTGIIDEESIVIC